LRLPGDPGVSVCRTARNLGEPAGRESIFALHNSNSRQSHRYQRGERSWRQPRTAIWAVFESEPLRHRSERPVWSEDRRCSIRRVSQAAKTPPRSSIAVAGWDPAAAFFPGEVGSACRSPRDPGPCAAFRRYRLGCRPCRARDRSMPGTGPGRGCRCPTLLSPHRRTDRAAQLDFAHFRSRNRPLR
jgi:hypothetical protein